MINHEKLNNILIDYKKDFKSNHWNNEKYKWEAVEHFQKNWDINASNFLDMFLQATEQTGNLLVSRNNFPRRMIQAFAEVDPEGVRSMFINLFDEKKDLLNRVEKFESDAETQRLNYNDGAGKQHYQHLNAISTYTLASLPG